MQHKAAIISSCKTCCSPDLHLNLVTVHVMSLAHAQPRNTTSMTGLTSSLCQVSQHHKHSFIFIVSTAMPCITSHVSPCIATYLPPPPLLSHPSCLPTPTPVSVLAPHSGQSLHASHLALHSDCADAHVPACARRCVWRCQPQTCWRWRAARQSPCSRVWPAHGQQRGCVRGVSLWNMRTFRKVGSRTLCSECLGRGQDGACCLLHVYALPALCLLTLLLWLQACQALSWSPAVGAELLHMMSQYITQTRVRHRDVLRRVLNVLPFSAAVVLPPSLFTSLPLSWSDCRCTRSHYQATARQPALPIPRTASASQQPPQTSTYVYWMQLPVTAPLFCPWVQEHWVR